VRYHDDHSGSLIQDISNRIGLVGNHPVTQTVHIHRDAKGQEWLEKRTVKNGKTYFYCTSTGESLYEKEAPKDLEDTGKSYKENYVGSFPEVVEWGSMNSDTTSVSPNCFPAKLTQSIYRYEVLDTEERNIWGTRGKMFPRALDRKAKGKLRRRYNETFGRDFIICDGFIVSTEKNEGEVITIEEEGYEVQFRNHGEVLLKDSDWTKETPEKFMQMLMYGLHKLADSAGFIKDTHLNKTVFWKHNDSESAIEIRQRGADWSAPDVRLHKVFHLKLGVGLDPETKDKKLFAFADISHKHLAARPLRDFINDFREKYENKEEWHKAVEDAFLRKRALVSYSSNWIKIEEIMWDESEEFQFTIKRKNEDPRKVTIKEYLENEKGLDIKSGAPCLIKCRIDGARGRRYCEHLPQHLFVTVSKERTSKADAEIKEREAMQDSDRLYAVKKFMKSFEDIQKPEFPLQIEARPLELNAFVFPEIKLQIKNTSHSLRDFKTGWAQNHDGFTEHSDGDEFGDSKSVAILATRNNSRSADNIQRTFESNYLRKRGISDCIKRVEVMEVRSFDKQDIDDELDRLGYMPDLVIAIIDDGKDGSMQKSQLARAAEGRFKTQCMVSSRSSKNAAVLGMLDDVIGKLGGVWYQVGYNFKTIEPQGIWAIGIDVYCSQSDACASGLSIQLCHNIEAGTMKHYIRGNFPLHPKEKIAPKEAMREAMKEIFKKCWDKGLKPPTNILIFRGGVAAGEIDILRTNELAGTIQAIYQSVGKKFKNLTYLLVPRGGTIRFHSKLRSPICVADTITGGFYQNFYTQVNTIARKTPRVVQYICLHDGDGFLSNLLKEEPSDWLKMIRGLCYLYPQSISFYNGPCSYPGPLKCAQNQAENYTQFILSEDKNLQDCDQLVDSLTGLFSKMELETLPEKAESSKPMPMAVEEHDPKSMEVQG